MFKILAAVPIIAEAIKDHNWLKKRDTTTFAPIGHSIIEGHVAKAMYLGLGNTFDVFSPKGEWNIDRAYYENLYFEAFKNPAFYTALNETLAKYGLVMREGEPTIAYNMKPALTLE